MRVLRRHRASESAANPSAEPEFRVSRFDPVDRSLLTWLAVMVGLWVCFVVLVPKIPTIEMGLLGFTEGSGGEGVAQSEGEGVARATASQAAALALEGEWDPEAAKLELVLPGQHGDGEDPGGEGVARELSGSGLVELVDAIELRFGDALVPELEPAWLSSQLGGLELESLRGCYAAEFERVGSLPARLELRVLVDVRGRVSASGLRGADLPGDELVACVDTAARQWGFSERSGVERVLAVLPIVLVSPERWEDQGGLQTQKLSQ